MPVSLSKRHSKPSPTILAFTNDQQVLDLMLRNCGIWRVDTQDFVLYFKRVESEKCGVVVLDDERILKRDRGWSLYKIQQLMPEAFVIYIASQHSPETEKTARARGAGLYLSKPVDGLRLKQMLDHLGRLHTRSNRF